MSGLHITSALSQRTASSELPYSMDNYSEEPLSLQPKLRAAPKMAFPTMAVRDPSEPLTQDARGYTNDTLNGGFKYQPAQPFTYRGPRFTPMSMLSQDDTALEQNANMFGDDLSQYTTQGQFLIVFIFNFYICYSYFIYTVYIVNIYNINFQLILFVLQIIKRL